MLFGDNLLDFDDPQQPTQASREQLVNKHQKILVRSILFS